MSSHHRQHQYRIDSIDYLHQDIPSASTMKLSLMGNAQCLATLAFSALCPALHSCHVSNVVPQPTRGLRNHGLGSDIASAGSQLPVIQSLLSMPLSWPSRFLIALTFFSATTCTPTKPPLKRQSGIGIVTGIDSRDQNGEETRRFLTSADMHIRHSLPSLGSAQHASQLPRSMEPLPPGS